MPQAFKDSKRACELTEWKNGLALETYVVALAGLGDFEAAVKWQKKAMEDAAYMRTYEKRARKLLEYCESALPGRPKPARD